MGFSLGRNIVWVGASCVLAGCVTNFSIVISSVGRCWREEIVKPSMERPDGGVGSDKLDCRLVQMSPRSTRLRYAKMRGGLRR